MSLFAALRTPREILFGAGQRKSLGLVARRHGTRVLVCTDARLAGDAVFAELRGLLTDAGLTVRVDATVEPDVPVASALARISAKAPHVYLSNTYSPYIAKSWPSCTPTVLATPNARAAIVRPYSTPPVQMRFPAKMPRMDCVASLLRRTVSHMSANPRTMNRTADRTRLGVTGSVWSTTGRPARTSSMARSSTACCSGFVFFLRASWSSWASGTSRNMRAG